MAVPTSGWVVYTSAVSIWLYPIRSAYLRMSTIRALFSAVGCPLFRSLMEVPVPIPIVIGSPETVVRVMVW